MILSRVNKTNEDFQYRIHSPVSLQRAFLEHVLPICHVLVFTATSCDTSLVKACATIYSSVIKALIQEKEKIDYPPGMMRLKCSLHFPFTLRTMLHDNLHAFFSSCLCVPERRMQTKDWLGKQAEFFIRICVPWGYESLREKANIFHLTDQSLCPATSGKSTAAPSHV